jgi:hypothetical protein
LSLSSKTNFAEVVEGTALLGDQVSKTKNNGAAVDSGFHGWIGFISAASESRFGRGATWAGRI